jgi:hypothetical protein
MKSSAVKNMMIVGISAWMLESAMLGASQYLVILKTLLFGLTQGQTKLVLDHHVQRANPGLAKASLGQIIQFRDHANRLKMKTFLLGALGALVVIVLWAISQSFYSDYRSKVIAESWLMQLEPLKSKIEPLIKTRSLMSVESRSKIRTEFSPANGDLFEIFENGSVLVMGGVEGQLILLVPIAKENSLEWGCFSSPKKSSPKVCNK